MTLHWTDGWFVEGDWIRTLPADTSEDAGDVEDGAGTASGNGWGSGDGWGFGDHLGDGRPVGEGWDYCGPGGEGEGYGTVEPLRYWRGSVLP